MAQVATDIPRPHQVAGEQSAPTGARGGRPRWAALAWGVAGLVVVLASIIGGVLVGPAQISVAQVLQVFAIESGVGEGFPGVAVSRLEHAMVWDLRLPRVLTAGFVGAGLAISGVIMQSLTRNPLADPYLVGLSSGASLGAVSVLVLSASVALPVAAFLGSLGALIATLGLARALGTVTPTRVILAGLAVSQLCSALVSFVVFTAASGDTYREVLAWLLGSLASASWDSAAIGVAVCIVVGLPLLATGNVLDAFTFGESHAHALGVRVEQWRWALLIAVALLVGVLVSISGAIGFIGIIVPHTVRLFTGPRHRLLLPFSAMCGAVFLMWSDTLARIIMEPKEIPVGVITALVGAPIFAWALYRHRSGTPQ